MNKDKWWKDGVRFKCQGSGNCCVSRGEYGYVYLTLKDRQNIAKELDLKTAQFTKKYCIKVDGYYTLKDVNNHCVFLKKHRCSVYQSRPEQCRTWPFWPDTMPAKAWKTDVANFCPGIGKGKVIHSEKIDIQIESFKKWDSILHKEHKG